MNYCVQFHGLRFKKNVCKFSYVKMRAIRMGSVQGHRQWLCHQECPHAGRASPVTMQWWDPLAWKGGWAPDPKVPLTGWAAQAWRKAPSTSNLHSEDNYAIVQH